MFLLLTGLDDTCAVGHKSLMLTMSTPLHVTYSVVSARVVSWVHFDFCVMSMTCPSVLTAKLFYMLTPILKDLHWLPVRERINFKLLLLTWKAINGLAPSYISNLLVPYKPVRALRSSDKHLLTVPRTSSTLGDRAFSVAAPTLWNSLPLDIRCCDSLQSFKTLLKTHL